MGFESRPPVTQVFLYLRKSTRDDEERQIRSIADQRAECLRLAERLNLDNVSKACKVMGYSRQQFYEKWSRVVGLWSWMK